MSKYQMAFGALKPKKDIREYKVARLYQSSLEIPDEFELSMPPVKNQGSVGSCVAHSISTIVEYFNQLQEDNNKTFSTGFIYGNRRNCNYTASGMYPDKAIHNVVKYGDVYNELFDYNVEVPEAIDLFEKNCLELSQDAYPHRFSEYYRLESEEEIKTHLLQYGPVAISIPWYKTYVMEKNTHVMYHSDDFIAGYHEVVIYGWNKYGWKFQNSWGTTFGYRGRAILSYDTQFQSCYGIRDEITSKMNQDAIDKLMKQLQNCRDQLDDKVKELELLQSQEQQKEEQNKELQKEIIELKQQMDAYVVELKRLYLLETELLEIKKPFKNMPKWLAEIINAILNLFK